MSRFKPPFRTAIRALSRILLLLTLTLPALLPAAVPAIAAPADSPAAQTPGIWVLMDGYPKSRSNLRVPYQPPTPSGTGQLRVEVERDRIVVNHTGTLIQSIEGPAANFDWRAVATFTAPPSELVPGEPFTIRAEINGDGALFRTRRGVESNISVNLQGFLDPASGVPVPNGARHILRVGNGLYDTPPGFYPSASKEWSLVIPQLTQAGGNVVLIVGMEHGAGNGAYRDPFAIMYEYTFRAGAVRSAPPVAAMPEPAAPAPPPAPEPAPVPVPAEPAPVLQDCGAANNAFDQIRMRYLATHNSLQTLRAYHELLTQKEVDLSQELFKGAVLDFASIVAGWPLGAAVDGLLGGAKLTFDQEILKAGFKSLDQKLLKDPDIQNAHDHVWNISWPDDALLPEGAPVDVMIEVAKQRFQGAVGEAAGEAVASTTFAMLDFMKFGWAAYQGMSQQQALSGMKNKVADKILAFEEDERKQKFIRERTAFALEICEFREKNRLPAEDLPDWAEISAYLGMA